MGRAAGAALTVVAPEAKAATKLAGKAGGAAAGRKPPVPDPRVTRPGSEAARQRQAVEDIKAKRPPEQSSEESSEGSEGSSGGRSLPSPDAMTRAAGMPAGASAAASTGSGFLLGVFAWALGLAYLRGGSKEVRKFLAAKFLNQTEGGS